MAKRDSSLLDIAAAAKRFRGEEPHGGGSLGNDPNLLTAVGQLLAAATSGSPGSQNQLAALLASALSAASGQASDLASQLALGGSAKPLGKWDAVVIPSICVGWLKGKQGAMIREIESRSGAVVDIDQSTKEMGHCTVNMHGDEESKRKAYGFVVAEMLKVADQPGSNMDCSAIGTKLPLIIDSKYVGWVKGPRGKVVQDITCRSNTRVDVDQTEIHLGRATINIYGTHENVQYARELIAFEVSKVSPEAAAELTGQPLDAASPAPLVLGSGAASFGNGCGASAQASSAAATGQSAGPHGALQIPSSYVGWLKGRQGAMIRDIESRSGATVDIDQSTKELGHCTVNIRGPEEQKKKAFGLIVAEVMKVSDQSGVPLENSTVGTKIEIAIDGKYVGWVKGPKGKVVQDITSRSSTRVDVDQSAGDLSRAIVKIYGTHEGVQCARDLVAFEISKVSPEAAAEITGTSPNAYAAVAPAHHHHHHNSSGAFFSHSSGSSVTLGGQAETGRYSALTIPSSYVGWIKGKQGAMVRDIEARSGAVVDIDQSTKELGHVQVNFRGDEESKKKAYGLVVAEVVKVSDQGGGSYDCSSIGTKLEIRIDGKYVGWVKGPRGKVVQDISTRSSTRVDMDQPSDNFATVRIYGTHDGVQAAKEFLAFEISKVSPEAAAEIAGAQQFASFQSGPASQVSGGAAAAGPDLAGVTALLASALGSIGAFDAQAALQNPSLSAQHAAAAQLTQSYLQQLATVAPNLLSGDTAAQARLC